MANNWREVRAKRPPREDRVAAHRAHLDEAALQPPPHAYGGTVNEPMPHGAAFPAWWSSSPTSHPDWWVYTPTDELVEFFYEPAGHELISGSAKEMDEVPGDWFATIARELTIRDHYAVLGVTITEQDDEGCVPQRPRSAPFEASPWVEPLLG